MTPEDIKKRLEALGISEGQWSKVKGKAYKGSHPLIESQRENLESVRELLKAQIDKDMKAVTQARQLLAILKKGGTKNG